MMGSVIYMFINSIMTSQKEKKNYVDKMCEKRKRERERKRYTNIMYDVYLKFFSIIHCRYVHK